MITITQQHHNDIKHAYKEAILKKNSLWLLPFYIAAATYCNHEKVHRMMRIAIASYLLNSNKFELTHLNKNMKRKKNCSKNFSEIKMILHKKTPTSNVCKRLQREYSCVKITRLIQKH